MVKFGTKDTSRGKKNGAIVNLEHYLRHDLAYFGPRCSIFLYTCKSEIILKKTHGKIIEFDFGIWLGRSKIIFVFQVTISKFFGSVGRKKKFFHEKSLCYRFHTISLNDTYQSQMMSSLDSIE